MTAASNKFDRSPTARFDVELSHLATSDLPPADFFRQLLDHILHTVSAAAAAAWGINQHGVLAKISEINRHAGGTTENAGDVRARVKDVIDLVSQRDAEPQVTRSSDSRELGALPAYVRLLVPLHHRDRCVGAVEIYLSGDTTDAVVAEQLRTVVEIADFAAQYVTRQMQPSPAVESAATHRQLADLTLLLHRSLDVQRVALAAVNEGRLLLRCDRLTLAIRKRGTTKIAAISGQDHVAERSNLVRAMSEVANLVWESNQPIFFGGAAEALPPQIEERIVAYATQSGARTIEIMPLRLSRLDDALEDNMASDETLAVLMFEHLTETGTKSTSRLTEAYAERVASALYNALLYQRATGMVPGWLVRRLSMTGQTKNAVQTMIAAVLVLLAVACMAIVPVPHRVEAEGTLVPVQRSQVFAPHDGIVRNVVVDGGQGVNQGQLLLRIENEELATQLLETRHRLHEKQQFLAMLEAKTSEVLKSSEEVDAIQLHGSISQTEIEIVGLQDRVAALERELVRLEIRATHSGNVATFQPRQRLLDRPIQRGELLLEVMEPDGPWQLELDLPARRAGHVFEAQRADHHGGLPVEFVLETLPERTFTGTVQRVSSTATVGSDRSVSVPVEVAVDAAEFPDRLAGLQVRARIDCGRKKLAYVLFGDVYDFIRRHVW